MDLINTVDKTHQNNPIEGDLGVDEKGVLFHFKNGVWKDIGKRATTDYEDILINKRRNMYADGTRNYYSESGIRMTIRPDGTEYIDKADMPA